MARLQRGIYSFHVSRLQQPLEWHVLFHEGLELAACSSCPVVPWWTGKGTGTIFIQSGCVGFRLVVEGLGANALAQTTALAQISFRPLSSAAFYFSRLSCCGSNFLSTSRRLCSRLLRQRLKRSCTSFEIFGTGFLASSATRRRDFGAALREGLMVGDRRFPGATTLGARLSTPSANHPVSVPPAGPELRDALLCGRCTRWQALYVQTSSLSWCRVSLSTLRRPSGQLLQRQSVFHVAASMADCCGGSTLGLVRRSDVSI